MKITGLIIKADSLNTTRFYVCTGNEMVTVDSHEELPVGKLLELTGEYTHYFFKAEEFKEISDKQLEKKVGEFLKFISPEAKLFTDAPALLQMSNLFENATEAIAKAVFELRPIKIRYDGDCDGILAGLILKKGIETFAANRKIPLFLRCQQSGGAVYREKDWEEDKATLMEGSLLILLDHGGNQESKPSLENSAKRFEIMVVDHHPPAPLHKHYIMNFVSPFNVKNCAEPSSYNTGMLSFEISRRLALEIEDTILPYRYYSMQADTSSFRKKEFFPQAVIVDYLAVTASEPRSLEYYDKTLANSNLVNELYSEEKVKIQSGLEKAISKAKVTEGKIRIVSCDVSGIVKKNTYPSLSKLHNAVQIRFSQDNQPTASLLYTKNNLSFRANHSAAEKGFSANKIIPVLREEFGNYGFTGGGHNVAASTRFPQDYAKQIVSTALKMVNQLNE
ncbi:MAG: hypothetical protein Q8R15_03485 [Candidatus Micrarchaeota archaeon]|nr:hypothetical protein [Candidatus Micrarchaeota archaeon]